MARRIARGRHAPPVDVRQARDRADLVAAGVALIEQGVEHLTAEAVSREAGMSKATFYELFAGIPDFTPYLLATIQCECDAVASPSFADRIRSTAAQEGVALSTQRAEGIARRLEAPRRCSHIDENGVRCITRLCFANPGPDCFIHQDEFARPAYDIEGPSARELLGRMMAAQPTPASERRAT